MRCFFALLLSEEVKARVVGLLERLRPSTTGIKWVRPEQLHITLRFFLSLGAAEQALVGNAAGACCQGVHPFELSVTGVKTFGPRGAVSTIWAGIEATAEGLSRFHGELGSALQSEGYGPDSRPFSPHLTLGRLREPSWSPALQEKLQKEAGFEGGVFTVDRLHLISSELRSTGPVYRTVGEWGFGALTTAVVEQRTMPRC